MPPTAIEAMLPDVNVLIAASRADHPHHEVAAEWLRAALRRADDNRPLLLLPTVAAAFLRLTTHARVFVQPTPIARAADFVEAVLATPGVQMPAQGAEWPLFVELCREHALAANDIPDAWIAAAARFHRLRLATFDRGFRRWLSARELELLSA